MKKAGQKNAFTLMELLVVITIIGILAALIMPALSKAIQRARTTKTLNEIHNILTAWNSYYREYGIWPEDSGSENTENLLNDDIRNILSGKDTTKNKRALPFMEFPKGEYLDHWKSEYRYVLDFNYDNKVNVPGYGEIEREIAVWSIGPDQEHNTDDDIVSWKE